MQDEPQFDLYGTLGVAAGASRDEIDAAFRAAAKREHPDTSLDPAGANRRMQRLNTARDWLTDPQRRRRYDLARGLGEPTAAVPDQPPPASVMPAIALIALMALLATLVVGIDRSLVTITVFALALLLFLGAGLITVLGWLR